MTLGTCVCAGSDPDGGDVTGPVLSTRIACAPELTVDSCPELGPTLVQVCRLPCLAGDTP